MHDRLGQVSQGNPLDQPLPGKAPNLHARRQAERMLHQFVVQERDTPLHRGPHGHPVAPVEEVVGQPHLAVRVQHRIQCMAWRTANMFL